MLIKKTHLKLLFLFVLLISCNLKENKTYNNKQSSTILNLEKKETNVSYLDKWQEGFLDIHHINTGSGDTCFMILPDGTTMLFDAGNLDKKKFEEKYAPLKATSPKPNDSLSAANWIALYIKNVVPKDSEPVIDYAVVSHLHSDHYGSLVELGKLIPIKKIIDRNYPNYDFPLDVKKYLSEDKLFQDYLTFISENKIPAESLNVGSSSQIKLLHQLEMYPTFQIKNIKSNATIMTGNGNDTFEYFSANEMTSYYEGKYNENPLSLALKISYGDFDYFTGGDNTGLQGFGLPYWFDVETPIAKAVGKVEVTTLNHHSNRDATNEFFVRTLNPKVVIQQSWCSDHPGQEVYQRLIYKDEQTEDRDIFATNMHDETLVTYGPWFKNNYKSIQGHIVVRVYPEGSKYEVYILNDDSTELTVKEKFGPYQSK